MTIAATGLVTSGSTTDSTTTYTTGTVTYSANDLVLAFVAVRASTGFAAGSTPGLSGASGTWDLIREQGTGAGSPFTHLWVYRCQNTSGGSGAITIDVSGLGVTVQVALWSFIKFTGCARGANGANAVVQSNSAFDGASNNVLNVLLSTFSSSLNATVGGIAVQVNEAITHPTGFTEIGDTTLTTPNLALETAFLASNDVALDWSWTTNIAAKTGIAVELRHDWYTNRRVRKLQAVGQAANW